MKLTFDRSEVKRGLVFKKPYIQVTTTVIFSETEMAVIKQQKLRNVKVAEFESKPEGLQFPCVWLHQVSDGKPLNIWFDTPTEANDYEQQITSGLKGLKNYLEENAQPQSGSKTIEL